MPLMWHHPSAGSGRTDLKGRIIDHFLQENALSQVPVKSFIHRHCRVTVHGTLADGRTNVRDPLTIRPFDLDIRVMYPVTTVIETQSQLLFSTFLHGILDVFSFGHLVVGRILRHVLCAVCSGPQGTTCWFRVRYNSCVHDTEYAQKPKLRPLRACGRMHPCDRYNHRTFTRNPGSDFIG